MRNQPPTLSLANFPGQGPGGSVLLGAAPRPAVPPSAASPAWARWHRLVDDLTDPDAELDIETFAALSATFGQLRRAGAQFDRGLVALMKILDRQAFAADMIGGGQ